MQKPLLVFLVAGLSAVAMAQTVTVPNGYASTIGNSNNTFPWGRLAANMRIQQVYDTSHFTLQGVTYPVILQGMRFRPYSGAVTSWTGGTWPNIRIDMASCPVDYTGVSTTFANNLGGDLATVVNGPVTVTAGSTLGTGVVVPTYVDVPFTTPFVYDPTSGNDLVFDVYLDGTGWSGTSRGADVVSGAAANALGCRIYNSTAATALTATTGTITQEHALICEFTYVPAAGLYAGFRADVTSGVSPLVVNFTDTTFSSDPNGITSWAWDFDGDSVIDSNLQNPTFVYANCGTYNVSLTVTDGTHAPNTHTKTAYITTDGITGNFTYQVIGPLAVQFTDTSNAPATSWAWDLDGDNLIDSTAQNPAWAYPNTLPVNVTLTVTRLCSAPSVITKTVVAAQQLTTVLVANNSVGTPATLYYDLNVLNPEGCLISSFDSVSTNLSTPFTVDWYVMTGSYVGSALTPAPWTFVGQASGTSNPVSGAPSNAGFAQPIYLPAGSYGIAMRYVGITPRYVTLTVPTTYGNGDLSLTAGSASLSTAGPFTGTNLNTPRAWCGTLYYTTHNITGEAGYGFFAPGCAGSLGASHFTANRPQLGTTLTVNVSNMPTSVGIMMTGFSNTNSVFGPLPFDVTIYGAPGCFGRVSTDATTLLLGAGNTASWSFSIPNNPALSGVKMFNQALVLDPGFNALGAVLSDAAAMLIGN